MSGRFVFKRELSRTKGKKTSKQLADLEEKRSSLIRQIMTWRPIQLAYTPHVASLLPLVQDDMTGGGHYSNPESMPLYLPSSLPPEIRHRPELKDICEAEHRLREAQADDALADVRRLRRVIQGLWQFKKLNVSGTGNRHNTRMLNSFSRFDTKLQLAANRYRVAYTALMALDRDGSWKERLKELKPSDLRGPGRDPDNPQDAKSNGRFEPSWIWLVTRLPQEKGDNQTEDEFNHSMRTEWAQTRARMCRWKEELLIIQEEMRRVLAFFEWKSAWWLKQANRRLNLESSVQSGVAAYAHKQSTLCLRMAARCAGYWIPVMKKHKIIPTWGSKYYQVVSSAGTQGGSVSDSENDEDPEVDKDDNRSDTDELNIDDILEFD
jgi:hypothetical protein